MVCVFEQHSGRVISLTIMLFSVMLDSFSMTKLLVMCCVFALQERCLYLHLRIIMHPDGGRGEVLG
jgi:hypothetical protein